MTPQSLMKLIQAVEELADVQQRFDRRLKAVEEWVQLEQDQFLESERRKARHD